MKTAEITREVELLEKAIAKRGISTAEFARTVVLREPSTVGRWLQLQSPIPAIVIEWLENDARQK